MPGWYQQMNLQKSILHNARLVATKESSEKNFRQCPAGINKVIFKKNFRQCPAGCNKGIYRKEF